MKFNNQNEYYVVKGWFETSNGLHDKTFYGAVATSDNLLTPKRIVVNGDDARLASEAASKQPAKVYPHELVESYDSGGLNPKEREDTQSLLLDCEQLRQWAKAGGNSVWSNGRKLFVSFHDSTEDVDAKIVELRKLYPGAEIEWDYETGPRDESGWQLVTEMTGSGGIAMGNFALNIDSPTNTGRLGMSDRGGHGRVDNLKSGKTRDSKQVRVGSNIRGNKGKSRTKGRGLKGFGDKSSLSSISTGNGRRGGSQ